MKTLHLYKIMAGQQGQPQYCFGWPGSLLGGLGPVGSMTPGTPNG